MPITAFIRRESGSGLLLIVAALLAMIMANTPFLSEIYGLLLSTPVSIQIGEFVLGKPLLLWINDGLMAIFFFLIGLEIKREFIEGELSSLDKALLPVIAAIGGMTVPALIYTLLNYGDPVTMRGWGIPVATDIAFALAILMLLGDRIPKSLKILLLGLAIMDDIGAILIIALFYTEDVSVMTLSFAFAGLLAAFILNRLRVAQIAPYAVVGIFMWVCVLKSGVHATLAGALLAMMIPLHVPEKQETPLLKIKQDLHPVVAYFILPLFAFANAGVSFQGLSLEFLFSPVTLGITGGLFLGKQIGVFGFSALAVKLGLCRLPADISWRHLYGMAVLTGIGFTMSLFIGTLAFNDPALGAQVRLAVFGASLLSACIGYFILKYQSGKICSSIENNAGRITFKIRKGK